MSLAFCLSVRGGSGSGSISSTGIVCFWFPCDARLNATLFGERHPDLACVLRFDTTHREMWLMAQLTARMGLHHTLRKTLKGKVVNVAFMTWDPPSELVGRESELISDMPRILTSLCEDSGMLAFGHNDFTTDNAYFFADPDGKLSFGAFDWQQSCVNNVGQEWAWNLHFLPPEFLSEHEPEFIAHILKTYEEFGVHIPRARFVQAYVLGTVQMFVFGGGGLQLLLSDLNRRGIFQGLVPNDPRCQGHSGFDAETLEKVVGAEMTRRTFTNCCNIMRRHDFVRHWDRWKQAGGKLVWEDAAPTSSGSGRKADQTNVTQRSQAQRTE
mmetsp:Transcript_142972/g.456843  ORF Transcript_142972/g.456843 Transcript_142972/m.456843 type:complete len:326 (-) Transcript_142972:336-1313(-)